jgi:hypothetical protein
MSSQDNKAAAEGLFHKALIICGHISAIAGTAQGLVWVLEKAIPHIQPLLDSGLFCPERFWHDGVQAKEVALDEAIEEVQSRRVYIIRELSDYTDEQRQRISAAYDAILSNIQKDHPNALQ